MSYQIVVAQYEEDISWLNKELHNCIIYNKGKNGLNINNIIRLPNIGRESHTYLYHIINNYDKLADITVFTQGRISDHKPEYKNNLVNYILKIKKEAEQFGISKYGTHTYLPNDDSCVSAELNYNKNTNEYFLKDNYFQNKPILFIDWFKKYTKCDFPTILKWYGNAIFAVSKKWIHNKSKSYYEELIKQVDHHVNPTEGHLMERIWYYMFANGDEEDIN
jgi:hypothetical protein